MSHIVPPVHPATGFSFNVPMRGFAVASVVLCACLVCAAAVEVRRLAGCVLQRSQQTKMPGLACSTVS